MPKLTLSINEFGPVSFAMVHVSPSKIFMTELTTKFLELKAGDKIKIAQDENEPATWYMYKHLDGWQTTDSINGGLSFNCSALCNMILECFEETANIVFQSMGNL